MANSKKADTTNNDEILQKALKRFTDSWDYAKGSYHKKWERDWKLFNNQRVSRSYEGITNTFIPMAFSTVVTIAAALGNGRPRFDYEPADPTKARTTKELNSLIDDYWEADRWDVKTYEALNQMLIVGNAVLFFYWDIDKPRMMHFPIRDAIVDPAATSPESLRYAGRRYLTTWDELNEYEVVDADTESKTYGQLKKRFNLPKKDELSSAVASTDDTDKSKKDMFIGSTVTNAQENQVEVLEIWDYDRVITIANRTYIIEDIENPYLVQSRKRGDKNPRGLLPFVFLRNYTDVSQFYAKSEIEPIVQLQEYLNDYSNMSGDTILKSLAAQRELDPAYEDWIDLIDDDPSTTYPFKPGSLAYITPPTIPANAFNERMNIKNEIRETTAIDQVAKGAANIKDTTATEVNAQLNQASQRIEIKARMLEKDGFFYMGQLLFRMIQLYVTTPQVVSADGLDRQVTTVVNNTPLPKGTAVYDPSNYEGDWTPHVQLDITAKQQAHDMQSQMLDAYKVLIADPTNNLPEIKKRLLPKIFDFLDPEDIDAITTPVPQPTMAPEGAISGAEPAPIALPEGTGVPVAPMQGAPDV